MNNTYLIGGVMLVAGFLGGYFLSGGDYTHTTSHSNENEMEMESSGGHSHTEMVMVPDGAPVPNVSLEVFADPKSGWNAKLTTENFTFAPENASLTHTFGEGHAHIYVDGEKINRVYGDWYHLGDLPVGEHEVKVSLSANNHAIYMANGEEIADTVTINVTPKPEFDRESATAYDVAIAERSLTPEVVTVTQGESVILNVSTDEDGVFHVAGYELETEIRADATTEVSFVADKAGRYNLELHPAGEDNNEHGEMADIEIGSLVVQPK